MGSTSALTYSDGGQTGAEVPGSRARYYPFGGPRTAPTQTITDRNFTGQKENMELGLIYYNARFYLPATARFLTPDSLIPDPTKPQSYNRFSYVENNPLKYIDPSGHCTQYAEDNLEEYNNCINQWAALIQYYHANSGSEIPIEYINWLYENATTSDLVSILERFGQEYDPETGKSKPIQEEAQQDCFYQQGIEVCSPEGGWPEYYPITEADKIWFDKWLEEQAINLLLTPVGPLVGKFVKPFIPRVIITKLLDVYFFKPIVKDCIKSCLQTTNTDQHDISRNPRRFNTNSGGGGKRGFR